MTPSGNTLVVCLGAGSLGAAAGLVGTYAMMRGKALVSDALAHATLPGVAAAFLAATYAGLSPRSMPLLMTGAALSAGMAWFMIERLSRNPRIGPDTATAATLAGTFGLGLALLSVVQTLGSGRQAGLETLLFGAAAAMLGHEALFLAGLAVTIIVALAAIARPLAALAFDPEFAQASGLDGRRLDGALAVLGLCIVVAALPVTGLILAVALLVIPPAAARFWSNRIGVVAGMAAFIGAGAAAVGAYLSAIAENLPTGPAIVLVATVVFTLSAAPIALRARAR